jgi:hypothetical protein
MEESDEMRCDCGTWTSAAEPMQRGRGSVAVVQWTRAGHVLADAKKLPGRIRGEENDTELSNEVQSK